MLRDRELRLDLFIQVLSPLDSMLTPAAKGG
jgi:hypothetical protein